MSGTLLGDIEAEYTDTYGLVTPKPYDRSTMGPLGSGNGAMYLGEMGVLLKLNGRMSEWFKGVFAARIQRCMVVPGLMSRGPGQPDLEGPDDYYGVLAGCVATGNVEIPRDILEFGALHFGAYDNTKPGHWNLVSLLWRQPQLLFSLFCAADERHFLSPLLALYTALVIATSCMFAHTDDCDARRLCWLLIQTVSHKSRLCRVASNLWYRRLHKQYGSYGMQAVRAIYYRGLPDGTPHPFVTWSVD